MRPLVGVKHKCDKVLEMRPEAVGSWNSWFWCAGNLSPVWHSAATMRARSAVEYPNTDAHCCSLSSGRSVRSASEYLHFCSGLCLHP